jgi:hypothetical protein
MQLKRIIFFYTYFKFNIVVLDIEIKNEKSILSILQNHKLIKFSFINFEIKVILKFMDEISIRIRSILIDKAKEFCITSYSDLNSKGGLQLDFKIDQDRRILGKILENILRYEIKNNRPLLTILVINRLIDQQYQEYLPSDKFYTIASRFKKYKGDFNPKSKLEIFNDQKKILFDFWSNPKNYEEYKDCK